jgi:hypothetical protein
VKRADINNRIAECVRTIAHHAGQMDVSIPYETPSEKKKPWVADVVTAATMRKLQWDISDAVVRLTRWMEANVCKEKNPKEPKR